MPDSNRRFLRDNLVLIAAVALPALVAGLFLLATAIPRWTVPPPQHDLVLRAERPYEAPPREVSVDLIVRDGRVEAIVRPVQKASERQPVVPAPARWGLLLFDRSAMEVREIPLDIPATLPEGETKTIVVEALSGRRVLAEGSAPDGYEADTPYRSSSGGIVSDLFGMNRSGYGRRLVLSRGGRTIEVPLPAPYRQTYGQVYPLGWIADGTGR